MPDMIGIIVIFTLFDGLSPVSCLTTEECISRVLSSPDMKCPLCGKHLEVWIYGEVPLYRCSICGGLGFQIDHALIKELLSKGRSHPVSETCPGCGGELIRSSIGKLMLDSCAICDWVFVEGGVEPITEDEDEDGNCSHYTATMVILGKMYEAVTSSL